MVTRRANLLTMSRRNKRKYKHTFGISNISLKKKFLNLSATSDFTIMKKCISPIYIN